MLRKFAESWWSIVVIAGLTGGIIYQRWEFSHRLAPQMWAVGERPPAPVLEDLQQNRATFTWASDGRPTVVYFMSPTCIWCKRNLESIRALAVAASDKYRFVGISSTRDGLPEYLEKAQYPFPVYFADATARKALKLSVTPETILISSEGVVVNDWRGAYGPDVVSSLHEVFAVPLPKLKQSGASTF